MVEADEPRTFTPREIQLLTQRLLETPRPGFVQHSHPNRPPPPFVRPVDHNCKLIAKVDNPLLTPHEKVHFFLDSSSNSL